MGESIILNTPLLWLLLGAALVLCLVDRTYRSSKGLLTAISAALAIAACSIALILGAGTGEVITVLLVFCLLGLEGWK